ncbi:CBS domain-containing protein [Lunatibacter salilacus]|uniref:CBS domain-containing protein n=1 Tax=Lunatibacter salilacus TaxID=2483804 RepID=UPI00131EC11B|nr:CBS domain-containing protein [Lunatibacter salilacus]
MENQQKNRLTAKEAMSRDLIFINGIASTGEAVDLMKEHQVDVLIVNKRNEFDAYGIVVAQDLIRGVLAASRSADDVSVYEIMTKPLVSVPSSMDVKYVARLLLNLGLKQVPVEENGTLIGIISLRSLVFDNGLF